MSLTSDIDFALTPSFDLALKEQDSLNSKPIIIVNIIFVKQF